ncbi:hypothetical protein ACOMHN_004734 [Nucella lapillus]
MTVDYNRRHNVVSPEDLSPGVNVWVPDLQKNVESEFPLLPCYAGITAANTQWVGRSHAAESERGGGRGVQVSRSHRAGLASCHAAESGWRGFQVSPNHGTASSLATHGADSTDSS